MTTTDNLDSQYDELMEIMRRDATDKQPIIPLHPSENPRDMVHTNRTEYTEQELEHLRQRDFQTRLFISSLSIDNAVWLRTHHSDNAERTTKFTFIRDYYKAARATFNHFSAKATMTTLLAVIFDKNESSYCSFATVVASGLSERAKHTSFEIHPNMVPNRSDLNQARHHLVLLMDILFRKVAIRKFLIGTNNFQNNCNIFRLVHCDTSGTGSSKYPMIYCIFSFSLQVCMTAFICFQILVDDQEDRTDRTDTLRYGLWVLAFLGSFYAFLVAIPEVTSTLRAIDVLYNGRMGVLCVVDIIVNIIIPLVLVVAGFIVIIQEDDGFLSAVLNTAAMLFIPEIDDRLPGLLGYDEKAIVENYLIDKAKREYNKYAKIKDQDHGVIESKIFDNDLGMEFNDYFITNSVERGMNKEDFALYQPYIVKLDKDGGEEIDPSNYITGDCLVSKIEWRYTDLAPNNTTKPRVGWLKIYKLQGKPVEIKYENEVRLQETVHRVPEGVYIITSIVLSNSILKLRLCGSKTARDFRNAIQYYSLWGLSFSAKRLLNKKQRDEEGLFGSLRRPSRMIVTNQTPDKFEDEPAEV